MQCEKKIIYHVVGLVQKKAYKVGCAMPVKRFKFDTMEVDKPKEEKFKVISNNKKNTGENPVDYLELKHRKKFKS